MKMMSYRLGAKASAAMALAKKGAKEVVLDADRVAGAASGRDGGRS